MYHSIHAKMICDTDMLSNQYVVIIYQRFSMIYGIVETLNHIKGLRPFKRTTKQKWNYQKKMQVEAIYRTIASAV